MIADDEAIMERLAKLTSRALYALAMVYFPDYRKKWARLTHTAPRESWNQVITARTNRRSRRRATQVDRRGTAKVGDSGRLAQGRSRWRHTPLCW